MVGFIAKLFGATADGTREIGASALRASLEEHLTIKTDRGQSGSRYYALGLHAAGELLHAQPNPTDLLRVGDSQEFKNRCLCAAASVGSIKAIMALIDAGADPNASVLIEAAHQRSSNKGRLGPRKAFPVPETISSPLECAARNGYLGSMQVLVERGAKNLDAAIQQIHDPALRTGPSFDAVVKTAARTAGNTTGTRPLTL